MRTPFTTALINPFNIAMLLLSVFAGLVAAWWLFPLGLLLWVIMVATIASDKSLRINYNMQALQGTLSPRFQGLYTNVVRAQMRIFNSLLSASGRTRRALEPVQKEVETLVSEVYTVCQRMTAPENYVKVSQAKTDLVGQRALLVLSMTGLTDPVVKKEKDEALHALDTRIQEIKETTAMLDRVEAQLTSLGTTMDTMLAEIMGLQAQGITQVEKEVPNLVRQLHEQVEQLQAVENKAAHPQ